MSPLDLDIENLREMRFAIWLILDRCRAIIRHGVVHKQTYQEEALRAVDPDEEGLEEIRELTAVALGEILEQAEWGFKPTSDEEAIALEDQPCNQTMRQVQVDLENVLDKLNQVLEVSRIRDNMPLRAWSP